MHNVSVGCEWKCGVLLNLKKKKKKEEVLARVLCFKQTHFKCGIMV